MATATQVMSYIRDLPPETLRATTAKQISEVVGGPREMIARALYGLERQGRLRLVRSDGRVSGIGEILRADVLKTRTPRAEGQRRKVGRPRKNAALKAVKEAEKASARQGYGYNPPTPELDAYTVAKKRAEQASGNRWLSVTFNADPMAEEGLACKDALNRLMEQYKDLSNKYKLLAASNQGIVDRIRQRTEEGVAESLLRDNLIAQG